MAKRSAAVIDLTRNDVVFKDRFACLRGRDELSDHLEAIQMHRPGKLRRCGEPRHCQGGVLAEWLIRSEDGEDLGHGTNFFELDGEGAIVAVIGFADS